MNREIERKFHIPVLPAIDLDRYPCHVIIQGYLSMPEDHSTVRIRKSNDQYYMTIKQRADEKGLVRLEEEIPISQSDFQRLLRLCDTRIIEKTRYEIPWKTQNIELDVFEAKLSGLILAEIEFKSVEECNSIELPEWFGRELTEDFRFTNSSLSFKGLPQDY